MARWRPPAPASSPYISPAGFARLQEELDELWARRRPVVRALADAAAEGDRSENAEYIYRKKELAGIDRRIRYLQKRLPLLEVVRQRPAGDRVFFGATVDVSDENGSTHKYRIVGPDETDTGAGAISMDSPLARALLRKRVDDELIVTIAGESRRLTVLAIDYE